MPETGGGSNTTQAAGFFLYICSFDSLLICKLGTLEYITNNEVEQ